MPGAGNRGVIWAVIGAALLSLLTATDGFAALGAAGRGRAARCFLGRTRL